MTSRTPILDQVLAIRNLLALNDHELEEIINVQQEKTEAMNLSFETERERKALEDSYTLDMDLTMKQYCNHYNLRKELQSELFKQYDIDMKYRCQFKHKLTIQEALKEIADATKSPEDRSRFQVFTKDLYIWIWQITGLWHTPCGRCLLDAEQEEKPIEEDQEKPDKKLEIMIDVVNHANKIIPGDYITYASYDHLRKRYGEEYPNWGVVYTCNIPYEAVARWLCDKHIINIVDSLMKDERTNVDRRTNDMFDLIKSKYEDRLLPFAKEGKRAFNKDFIDKICKDITVDETALPTNKNQDD